MSHLQNLFQKSQFLSKITFINQAMRTFKVALKYFQTPDFTEFSRCGSPPPRFGGGYFLPPKPPGKSIPPKLCSRGGPFNLLAGGPKLCRSGPGRSKVAFSPILHSILNSSNNNNSFHLKTKYVYNSLYHVLRKTKFFLGTRFKIVSFVAACKCFFIKFQTRFCIKIIYLWWKYWNSLVYTNLLNIRWFTIHACAYMSAPASKQYQPTFVNYISMYKCWFVDVHYWHQ